MPRKKKRIVSLEVLEPNSLADYSQSKTLKNFICDADDAEKVIMEMDRKERWKHEKDYKEQVKAVLAPRGTRGASDTFFTDLVAVDEIKAKLSSTADKLLSYPNYIGTIQSFVNKYVTMQYIRGRCKTNLQFVSDKEYAHYLYKLIWRDKSRNSPYYSLRYYMYLPVLSGYYSYA
jgi:hypothetical protein